MTKQSTLERYVRQQQLLSGETLYADFVNAAAAAVDHSGDSETGRRLIPVLDNAPEERHTMNASPMATSKSWQNSRSLDVLESAICECQNCTLGATRTKFVFGVGNPDADIVVIGEAPGADEDAQGEPFVGRAGQLLTKILEAVNFQRSDVFICNILKCRPPGNRTPLPAEVDECEPYLYKQLELIKPTFILALGLTAVNTLMKSKYKMADVRGKFLNYQNVRTLVTYHPAALLRNPEWKKATWEDVKLLRGSYDLYKLNGTLPSYSM